MSGLEPNLKVWCILKHDNFTIIEMRVSGNVWDFIQTIKDVGGLAYKMMFIPWHRIDHFEVL